MANGDPRTDVQVQWTSLQPAVASIDAAGFVTGLAPGRVTIQASVGSAIGLR